MGDVEMTDTNDCEYKTVFSRKKRKMSKSKKEKIFDSLEGHEIILLKYRKDNEIKYFTGTYFSKFHDWLTNEWSLILKHPGTGNVKIFEDTVFAEFSNIIHIAVIGSDPNNVPFKQFHTTKSGDEEEEQSQEEEEEVNTGQVKKLTHIFEEMGKVKKEEKAISSPTDTLNITEDQAKAWHKKHRILVDDDTLQEVLKDKKRWEMEIDENAKLHLDSTAIENLRIDFTKSIKNGYDTASNTSKIMTTPDHKLLFQTAKQKYDQQLQTVMGLKISPRDYKATMETITEELKHIPIPTLDNGDVDILLLEFQYHKHQTGEDWNQYRVRRGIQEYKTVLETKEDYPPIYKKISRLKPDQQQFLKSQWFESCSIKEISFQQWWNETGKTIPILFANGMEKPAEEVLKHKIAEAIAEAISYIATQEEPMKNRLEYILVAWISEYGKNIFENFETYAQEDETLKQLKEIFDPRMEIEEENMPRLEDKQEDFYEQILQEKELIEDEGFKVSSSKMTHWTTPYYSNCGHFMEYTTLGGELHNTIQHNPNAFPVKDDFLPGGKYAHIYIPQYCHIPWLVSDMMFGRRHLKQAEKLILWYRLSHARNEAINELLQVEDPWQLRQVKEKGETRPLPDLETPWLKYLTKGSSFKTASIDVVQQSYAHQWFEKYQKLFSKPRMREITYDLFIRPLERLFGYDMPLAKKLLNCLEDMATQKVLKTYILGMTQLKYPEFLTSNYILEEISRVRCHMGKTLWRTPPKTMPPIERMTHFYFKHEDEFEGRRWYNWEAPYKPPTAEDYYPQGRLFGLYVDIQEPIPRNIWKKFFQEQPSEIDEANLRCEMVLAKAEWTRQIHNQIIVQSGVQQGEQSLPQYLPPWAYYSLEKPRQLLETIQQRRETFLQGEQRNEEPMDTNTTPSQPEPTKEEKARTPFHYPIPTEAGFTPDEWNMETITTPLEKINIIAAKTRHWRIRKNRSTFFPDQDRSRKIPDESKLLDWNYTSPMEYERQLDNILNKNKVPEIPHGTVDWTVQEKNGQDLSPSSLTHNNPYMWNGCRKFIPMWATMPLSAKQIRKTPPMMIPKYLINRVSEGTSYKVIPLDGVNKVQDLIIRHVIINFESHMLLQVLTKQRHTWQTAYEKRSLLIPFYVMPDILKALEMMSKTILPKAELDFDTEHNTLFKTLVSSANKDYLMDVIIISGRQGDERLVRIYQEDQQANLTGCFVYPWLYTMTVIAHLQSMYEKHRQTQVEATTFL